MKVKEFLKALEERNEERKKDGKRLVSTFSRRDFDQLAMITLNDPDYQTEVCSIKNGELHENTIEPVKDFRLKFLKPIFLDCKLDKEDAEAKAKNYKFTKSQAETLYPLINDMIYNYINTGKKFNMLSRKDFIGSIGIKHNEESVVENHIHGTKTKRGAYKSLTKKSGTPSWLKEKL